MTSTSSDRLKITGTWSLIGLLMLLFAVGFFHPVTFWEILQDVWSIFIHGPAGTTFNYVGTLPLDILADIAIMLLVEITIVMIISPLIALVKKRVQRETGEEEISELPEYLDEILDKGTLTFFGVMISEEIIRLITLGWLWNIMGNTNITFYILFLLGNGIWSLIHLANYKKRVPLAMVLPQFIGGFFLSVIFVKYGFWVTVFAHFWYDVILLSTMKEQKAKISDFLTIAYEVLVVFGVFLALVFTKTEYGLALSQWLVDMDASWLDHFALWQYVLVIYMFTTIASLVGDFLGLDPITTYDEQNYAEEKQDTNLLHYTIESAGKGLATGIMYAIVFLVVRLFTKDIIAQVTIVALFYSVTQDTESGSAMARAALTNLPAYFLYTAAYVVLGFWQTVFLIFFIHMFDYIPGVIRVLVHEYVEPQWENLGEEEDSTFEGIQKALQEALEQSETSD